MSTLGAPSELGDLDVVAWRDGQSQVCLIECKRLQPAKTIGEIIEVLNQFRGEARDHLGRHMSRCAWVSEHAEALLRLIDATTVAPEFRPLLVTNRDVPMRFRTDLPLPTDSIIPLADVPRRLA